VVLNLLEGIGPVRVRQLLECFGDAAKVLQANRSALVRVKGIGDDLADPLTPALTALACGRRAVSTCGTIPSVAPAASRAP